MNVGTIPKTEYKKLQREQRELRAQVSELLVFVKKIAKEELYPAIVKRLNKRSRRLDRGEGIRFSSTAGMKKYLGGL